MTGGDGFANAKAKGVLDSSDGHQGQIGREVLVRDLVFRLEVGFGGGPAVKVPAAERGRPRHLARVENNCPRDIVPGDVGDRPRFDLGVRVLTLVRIPGDDGVICAPLGEDLRRALEEKTMAAGVETDNAFRSLENGVIWTI